MAGERVVTESGRLISSDQLRRLCEQDELVRVIVEARQAEVKALVDAINIFIDGVLSHVVHGTPAMPGRDDE